MHININRSYLFWTIFALFLTTSVWVTKHYFSIAFPIVHLDIRMDRTEALQEANKFTKMYALGPDLYHTASDFYLDNETKTFIELEAGGKEAIFSLLENHWYELYVWRVRHFAEFNPHEITLFFAPNGTLNGFVETISENDPGNNLSVDAARNQAIKAAEKLLNIDFTVYTALESARTIQPSGRIDHSFTYERNDRTIGDGRYRLEIIISGDRCTKLKQTIKIPEDFSRRYKEIRSSNTTIAWIATLCMLLFYLLGFAIFGFLYLIRNKALWIRPAIICGCTIAFLSTIASLNNFPLLWMQYQTELSRANFILSLGIQHLFSFLYNAFFFSFICVVAEGLTRRAFPDQTQLWNWIHPTVAATKPIIARTIGSYGMVLIDLCFVTLFYTITTRFFGWWVPSESLTNPNILATYAPWFSSLAISLQAGFIEECLFRAIPLAAAALIGDRYKARTPFILIMCIIQALIFGGAHATYPALPSYARLIELIIPSLLFAFLYLRFGLITGIIYHVVYDVFWFALPLFISHAANAWINQFIITAISLLPIFIIIYSRLKIGFFSQEIPENYLNKSWFSKIKLNEERPVQSCEAKNHIIGKNHLKTVFLLGILGTVLFVTFTPFKQDAPLLKISRSEAIEKAYEELTKMDVSLDPEIWKPYAYIDEEYSLPLKNRITQQFVWNILGKEWYQKLIGDHYIEEPKWIVRFLRFSGSSIERAEEYTINLSGDGTLIQYTHRLAESTTGSDQEETVARSIALKMVTTNYALKPDDLEEVSATPEKLPNRTDWTFIFKVKKESLNIPNGDARISMTIADNQVIDAHRFVHVPESWEREEKNRMQFESNIKRLFLLLAVFFFFITIGITFYHKHRFQIALYSCILFALTTTVLLIFDILNMIPIIIALYNTIEPFQTQVFRSFSGLFLLLVIRVFAGTVAFFVFFLPQKQSSLSFVQSIYATLCTGLFLAGINALGANIIALNEPFWNSLSMFDRIVPEYAYFIYKIINLFKYLVMTALLFFAYSIIETWGNRSFLIKILLACSLGLLWSSNQLITTWLLQGAFCAIGLILVYEVIGRFDQRTVSGSLIVMSVCSMVQDMVIYQQIIPFFPTFLCFCGLFFFVMQKTKTKN